MKYVRTDTVTKFTHKDGSETSIKFGPSGEFDSNLDKVEKHNNKYSVVASISSGCELACKFCHLTQNKVKYQALTAKQVLDNLKEAVTKQIELTPELVARDLKLCWMGMGDPFLHLEEVYEVTRLFLMWIAKEGYAKALDSVDVSTAYPKNAGSAKHALIKLASICKFWNGEGQHSLRVFYSLHSTNPRVRKNLMPRTEDAREIVPYLTKLCKDIGIPFHVHYAMIEGINDTDEQLIDLNNLGLENLRILRYNAGPDPRYKENASAISKVDNAKIQFSDGTEVNAACGEFL